MIVNMSQLFQLNNQPRAILRIRSYCSSSISSRREVFFIAILLGEMRVLTNVLISLIYIFLVYYNFELYSSSVQIHVYITIVYILQR